MIGKRVAVASASGIVCYGVSALFPPFTAGVSLVAAHTAIVAGTAAGVGVAHWRRCTKQEQLISDTMVAGISSGILCWTFGIVFAPYTALVAGTVAGNMLSIRSRR